MDITPFRTGTFQKKSPEDMSDREMLICTYNLLSEVYSFIATMKGTYDQVVSTIEIDSRTLMDLTGMSKPTLTRWRTAKKLRYYVRHDGSCYCKFDELYIDVKSGRLDGKGFCRIETLARLQAYQRGYVKSHCSHLAFSDDESANK